MPRPDYRSPEAAAYRKLYKSARWRRLRKGHLTAHPLCVMCLTQGRVTAANVADHKTPHRGDMALFWDAENLQSLCEPHHNGAKQAEDHAGFSKAVGLDGFPIDPRHPANQRG